MRLARRDGTALPLSRAALLSAAWGLGVGIGAALGAVITATSGAGAPGVRAIETATDLVGLPLGAALAVFLLHFGATLVLGSLRARAGARERVAHRRQEDEDRQDEDVER